MDGPKGINSNSIDPRMRTLYFQDLVILKQYIEKGFRHNIFIGDEDSSAKMIKTKLSNIISDIMDKEKCKNNGTI